MQKDGAVGTVNTDLTPWSISQHAVILYLYVLSSSSSSSSPLSSAERETASWIFPFPQTGNFPHDPRKMQPPGSHGTGPPLRLFTDGGAERVLS